MLMQTLDQTSSPDENVHLARFGLQLSGHQVVVQVSGRWEREEEWGVSGGGLAVVVRGELIWEWWFVRQLINT